MKEYQKFLTKFYPQVNYSVDCSSLYMLVVENNIMTKLFLKYKNKKDGEDIFYKRFRDAVNKLLIYVPLNDGIGINACMRYLIEQFLKYIYSIYFNLTIKNINKISYRHIKEDFKEKENIEEKILCRLEKLYSFYAKYSNDVHECSIVYEKELTFLAKILKEDNIYISKIISDLQKILFVTYEIMFYIFGMKYEKFSFPDRTLVNKIHSKKRRQKILQWLK